MMACDQMDAFTCEMPTQEMIEKMSDTIYDDICRMYPDMAEYVRCTEPKINADPPQSRLFLILIGKEICLDAVLDEEGYLETFLMFSYSPSSSGAEEDFFE